jgi:CMP-N-acetylneuraminic acid synthetase
MARCLAVIPARGGSKGIPRKNLRALNGKPLIFYAINNALESSRLSDVYVTSEDDEILSIASKLGARTFKRRSELAGDAITLDAVVHEVVEALSAGASDPYSYVATLQPTSPLLSSATIDRALKHLADNGRIDTIISAVEDTHLTWKPGPEGPIPNYHQRLNRQQLPKSYRETGGFLITRAQYVTPTSRIGGSVELFLLSGGEAIDIDTFEDWSVCEYLLRRKKILFVVTGNEQIGLGHAYRTLTLASQLVEHRLVFLADSGSRLAFEKINAQNYECHVQQEPDLVEEIVRLRPDVVVNDILDTDASYMRRLKDLGFVTINFEDLGEGSRLADVAINALYPEKAPYINHYYGHEYFCARDEFHFTPPKEVGLAVKNILVTFGGTDPNNLTQKVISAIHDFCASRGITITVVAGLGYTHQAGLASFSQVRLARDVRNMSDYMLGADIAFTSAGRTVYEMACVGTPCVVLAQNEREMTHLFASAENGFMHLGLGKDASGPSILTALKELVDSYDQRKHMNEVMLSRKLLDGRERVLKIIRTLIGSKP